MWGLVGKLYSTCLFSYLCVGLFFRTTLPFGIKSSCLCVPFHLFISVNCPGPCTHVLPLTLPLLNIQAFNIQVCSSFTCTASSESKHTFRNSSNQSFFFFNSVCNRNSLYIYTVCTAFVHVLCIIHIKSLNYIAVAFISLCSLCYVFMTSFTHATHTHKTSH